MSEAGGILFIFTSEAICSYLLQKWKEKLGSGGFKVLDVRMQKSSGQGEEDGIWEGEDGGGGRGEGGVGVNRLWIDL